MSEERITDGYKDSADIEWEAEKICRWAAARAGVIVVAPLIGTMTLMANEVYMITRLAELPIGLLRCYLCGSNPSNTDSLRAGADSCRHFRHLRRG